MLPLFVYKKKHSIKLVNALCNIMPLVLYQHLALLKGFHHTRTNLTKILVSIKSNSD